MAIGKVIKGDGAVEPVGERPPLRPPRAGVVSGEVYEAQQSAQGIVETAHRKAAEILEEAKRQREKLFADAKEAGRQEGLAQVTELLVRAKLQAGELLASNQKDALALACKVAEKIIGRDVERDPNTLIDICATAVEHVRNAKSMVLRVNPKSAAFLREKRKDLMDLIGRAVDVAIKEDAEIAGIGCVIQTEFGTIDAQLPTQLEMLERVLLDDNTHPEGPA